MNNQDLRQASGVVNLLSLADQLEGEQSKHLND